MHSLLKTWAGPRLNFLWMKRYFCHLHRTFQPPHPSAVIELPLGDGRTLAMAFRANCRCAVGRGELAEIIPLLLLAEILAWIQSTEYHKRSIYLFKTFMSSNFSQAIGTKGGRHYEKVVIRIMLSSVINLLVVSRKELIQEKWIVIRILYGISYIEYTLKYILLKQFKQTWLKTIPHSQLEKQMFSIFLKNNLAGVLGEMFLLL